METVRTILIHTQEIKKEKQSFPASSAEINGKWFKIKFTKDCDGAPRTRGLYDLTIDFDECSIEKGKMYTTSNGEQKKSNDTIWVRHIVGLRKYSEEELKKANRMAMENVFGSETVDPDNLPF